MNKTLNRLSDLNAYQVRAEDPNVVNWPVLIENSVIGRVNDLIVDLDEMKVMYLEVSLADEYQKLNKKPLYILLPVELVNLDNRTKEAWAPRFSITHIEGYPSYERRDITPEYEEKLKNHCEMILHEKESAEETTLPAGGTPDVKPSGQADVKLRLKYLETQKELKAVQTEKEIALLERDLAMAQLRLEQFVATGKKRK